MYVYRRLSCARNVVHIRWPLVRDCGSCTRANRPAGRSGGSLIFGTRRRRRRRRLSHSLSLSHRTRQPVSRVPIAPAGSAAAAAAARVGHIAPKQNASRPTNRECIDSEKYAQASADAAADGAATTTKTTADLRVRPDDPATGRERVVVLS